MNTLSILKELRKVIDQRLKRYHCTNDNINECKSEAVSIIKGDHILSEFYPIVKARLLSHVADKAETDTQQKALAYQIEYSLNIIESTYLNNLLIKIKCNKVIAIATYGRINHGNSLYNLRYKFNLPLIGACYFQTRHSYLKDDDFIPNYDCLIPLINRFKNKEANIIDIKKSKSTLGYNFFPNLRARLSVKIVLDKNKCSSCNLCLKNCLNKAIVNGRINHNCIRCLSCVYNCPNNALDFKLSKILKIYLKNQKNNQIEVYY